MEFIIYNPQFVSMEEFVQFWAGKYNYPQEDSYVEHVGNITNENCIWNLFEWKNGGPLSVKKRRSIQEIYMPAFKAPPPILDNLDDGKRYLENLGGGAIWGIFWLHCLKPNIYPIFDQHTYRAMVSLCHSKNLPPEIPTKNAIKVQIYFTSYIEFYNQFIANYGRNVDKALFSYGRFLRKGFAGK